MAYISNFLVINFQKKNLMDYISRSYDYMVGGGNLILFVERNLT